MVVQVPNVEQHERIIRPLVEQEKQALTTKIEEFILGKRENDLFYVDHVVYEQKIRPLNFSDAMEYAHRRHDIIPGMFPEDSDTLFEERIVPLRGYDITGLRQHLNQDFVGSLVGYNHRQVSVLLINQRVYQDHVLTLEDDEAPTKACIVPCLSVCALILIVGLVAVAAFSSD